MVDRGPGLFRAVSRIPILLVAGALLLAMTAGLTFIVTEHRLFPHQYLARAERAVRSVLIRMAPTAFDDSARSARIATSLVNLRYTSIEVPVARAGAGGALTSVGDELLLLTHEGGIWLVEPDKVTRTGIAAPANGFEQYVAFAESTTLRHRFDRFRFNDIVYYADGGRKGLLVSFTEWHDQDECYVTAVSELRLPGTVESILDVSATPSDWAVTYRTRPCLPLKDRFRALEGHMAGGRLAYYGDSHVLLSTGDYHWDGYYGLEVLAQSDDADYGKILDIDIESGVARAISKGHRNPQGVYVDRDGNIWSTEHGPRGGDELNKIIDGSNYGWPLATYGTNYNGSPHPTALEYGRHEQFTAPVYAWVPSIGVSNVTGIAGFDPAWDGDLLVASLGAGSLFRLRLAEDRVVLAEPIWLDERVRYVHQHTNERIVLWTDDHEVMFLTLEPRDARSEIEDILTIESDLSEAERAAVMSALDQCSECHSFDPDDHQRAPGLGFVFGQRIGSTPYRSYSSAMARAGETWTEDTMLRFLEDPQSVVPGTSMPSPEIVDPRVRFEIAAVLRALAQETKLRSTGDN